MRPLIRIVLAVVLCTIAEAPTMDSRSSQRDTWPAVAELDAAISESVARFRVAGDLHRARMNQLTGGTVVEAGSAGFHLVEQVPPLMGDDPFDQGVFGTLRGDLKMTGFYPFLDVHVAERPDGCRSSLSAAWPRLFMNSTVSSCRLDCDPNHPGKFIVQISFNTEGIQTLAALLETEPGCTSVFGAAPVSDWAGYERRPGDLLTEMRAVLIRDNRAYLCWSASAYVLTNQPDQPIAIADDLELQHAIEIRTALGF